MFHQQRQWEQCSKVGRSWQPTATFKRALDQMSLIISISGNHQSLTKKEARKK
jgi:hypothetical protein